MYPHGLQRATSRAYSGFLSHFDGIHGMPDDFKAGEFFRKEREKQKPENMTIRDREYPQQPPHSYIPGKPSPLHFGVPLSDKYDPGVCAVSHALFGGSSVFTNIPIEIKPVFRRRRRGDGLPEWSNAFVTRVDPCECVSPEETYTPYEVARYRDADSRTQTVLNFGA